MRQAALAMLATAWFGAPLVAETFPFTGVVTGPSGAIAGAQVRVYAYERPNPGTDLLAVTGADGRFALEVPRGQMDIRVVPPAGSGLAEDSTNFVEVVSALDGRFRLDRRVTISGRCSFPAGGRNLGVEVHSLSGPRRYDFPFDPGSGVFAHEVVGDHYSIHCRAFAGSDFSFGRANVDATSGNALAGTIAMAANPPLLPRTPPTASLIAIGPADAQGVAEITGAPGAVLPHSTVAVANQNTQQLAVTVSRADGSFSARMFAPPGASILVKHDPTGRYLSNTSFNGTLNELAIPPGTIVRVPVEGANAFGAGAAMSYYDALRGFHGDFATLARFGTTDPGQWWITGTLDGTSWTPGERMTIRGRITLDSRNIDASTDLTKIEMRGDLSFERLFDDRGGALMASPQFLSSLMTPSGLPIERFGHGGVGGQFRIANARFVAPHRVEGDWTCELRLPNPTPTGLYLPRITPQFVGIEAQKLHFDLFASVESGGTQGGLLPPVRIGPPAPRRLYWVLGLDELVNGHRGGVALEDRGRFQVASHVLVASDVQILPPRDERTGAPIRYRLEPFVPMISSSTARLTHVPMIPFRFPSGSLTVRVAKPDGTVDDLGTAPFAQSTSSTPTFRSGESIHGASSSVTDYYQLTALDPRFEYSFTQYGRHVVTMTGWIEDLWGNRYDGGGTYEVWIARPLDIETAVLPGTPFEVGNVIAPAFVVQPPVPAEIEITTKLYPGSDPSRVRVQQSRGRANRFGYGRAGAPDPLMDTAGEYRYDVVARHVDASGTLWMGAATWGSVVETPGSSLVAKGRRGFDGVNAIQQQWFRVREARAGGDHVMFPFHTGDVMWMQKDDPAADIPKISVQDLTGAFAARVRNRQGPHEGPSLDERITAGEIPLFTWSSRQTDAALAPEWVDQWAYFYAYAERPGVRVREFISEDASQNGYWRFADNYHFQLGNGGGGDLPNDFKFQFAGAVFRDATDGFRWYGAYASLFVLLPFNDEIGGRVFPPFTLEGGPILRLKGEDVDAFFHPTGVRAGTILQRGETATFAGYVAPTLPARVEILVTAPSGAQRTIAGRANKIGYFRPFADFVVGETGVWKAKVRVICDVPTSAGPLAEPYPTGGVLGSREGELYFYVVDGESPQLGVTPLPRFVRPADGPIAIDVQPPAGLSGVTLTYTTAMPGLILEERTQSSMRYVYDAPALANTFPNLDLHDHEGFAGADTITISLFVTGTDAGGARRHFARQIVIQGEEVQMPDQLPHPRRRAVR